MSTPERAVLVAASLLWAGAAAAQDGSRSSADLPAELSETGELAPEAPAGSSAGDVGNVDPDAGAYGIGQPATGEEIAAIDIDLMPGGAGTLQGRGSYAEGEEIYATACASCHGESLEGISDLGAPRLIGGRGTLATDAPVKTVESYWPYASTLVDYVHRAMPMNAPGSLSADEVYAVSAYILGRAGIVGEDFELSLGTIGEVEMPNARGFIEDSRPDVQ